MKNVRLWVCVWAAVSILTCWSAQAVWAKGAWVRVNKPEAIAKALQDNQWHKHTVKNSGCVCTGSHDSEPYGVWESGQVSWDDPDDTLWPGKPVKFKADMGVSVRLRNDEPTNSSVAFNISRNIYDLKGRYLDGGSYPGIFHKAHTGGKKQASESWPGQWVPDGGGADRMLRVIYWADVPGGTCETHYVYRFDQDAEPVEKPVKKKEPLTVSLEFKPPKNRILVNENVRIVATIKGGTPPYDLLWQGNTKSDSNQVNYRPNVAGQHSVTLKVTDAEKQTANATKHFKVEAATPPPPLTVSLSAPKTRIAIGEKLRVEARVKGGTPPYDLLWMGTSKSKSLVADFTPKSAGVKKITVQVSDPGGQVAEASLLVTVVGTSTAGQFKVKLVSSPSEDSVEEITRVLVHRLVTVRAVVTGGNGKYTYEWSGDRGWTSQNPSEVIYVSDKPCEANLSVKVTEKGTNRTAFDWLRLKVMGVNLSGSFGGASMESIPRGQPVTFSVSIDGNNFDKDSPYKGQPLYVLWQPHPEVPFRDHDRPGEPKFEKSGLNPIKSGDSVDVTFEEPGPKTIWAEVMVVVGPEKILVGEYRWYVNVR